MTRGACLILAILLTWVRPACAQDPTDPVSRPPLKTAPEEPPPPRDPPRWDGNATGLVLGPTWTHLDKALPGVDQTGWGVRLAGRVSFVAQFLDLELGLEHANHGGAGGLTRTDLGAQVGLHPGFPLLVFNDFLSDIVASFHGVGGVSLVRASLGNPLLIPTSGGTDVDWRLCLTVGAGIDIPLSSRDLDHGWWLTARYTLRWMNFGHYNPDLSLSDSQALLLIGYRAYGNEWARIKPPFPYSKE
jgi:hypothetical protein